MDSVWVKSYCGKDITEELMRLFLTLTQSIRGREPMAHEPGMALLTLASGSCCWREGACEAVKSTAAQIA